MKAGGLPRRSTICSSVLTVSSEVMRRAAGVASASRVCSSVIARILIGLPSAVRSERKSSAHTWSGQAAATCRASAGLACAGEPWLVGAAPRRATTFARACGCTPSPPGRGARGYAGSRSADAASPTNAGAPSTAPRQRHTSARTAAPSDAASPPDTLCALRPGNDSAGATQPCAAAPGSPVSPSHLPQHVDVELLLGQQPLQPGVLLLQLLQPHHILRPHRLVLRSPAPIGLDRDLQMPANIRQLSALRELPVRLPKLPDDLLRRVPPALHESHLLRPFGR